MQKRLYHDEMKRMIAELKVKPRLLLHVCCAPCSTAVLEQLHPYFHITAYYYNPNIDTLAEHDKRAQEEKCFAAQSRWAQDVITVPYDPEAFYSAARGLESDREGGGRCERCFRLRLNNTAQYAAHHGYGYFTTTLTISPHKKAALLNRAGEAAAVRYGVIFLPSDFKKQGGYLRSAELSKEYGMYRQDYCGCVYSKIGRDARTF